MSEESTTPDLVERWQGLTEAISRVDLEAFMGSVAPDAVLEAQPLGTTVDGAVPIRRFMKDWAGDYEEYGQEVVEGRKLGSNVFFAVIRHDIRPLDSVARMQERWAVVFVWGAGLIVRVVASRDIDAARAAAELLAEERG